MIHRFKTAVLALGLGTLAAAASLHAQTLAQAPAQAPAQMPAQMSQYGVSMDIGIHGEQAAPRLLVREREPFAVAGEQGGTPWRVEFTLDRTPERMVRLAGRIIEGGKTVAAPVLVGRLGERVSVKVGEDVSVVLVVQESAG